MKPLIILAAGLLVGCIVSEKGKDVEPDVHPCTIDTAMVVSSKTVGKRNDSEFVWEMEYYFRLRNGELHRPKARADHSGGLTKYSIYSEGAVYPWCYARPADSI